ncbi:MAG TPA: FemAB family XrtA/PEP-CTERM system-associated protein [Alphaproteobacteria bacterium]
MSASIAVRTLDAADAPRWDAFVADCAEATFFHRAGWREAIERGLGRSCHFLYAERSGEIRGVLPLVHVNSALFGHSLVSTGFTVGGGPVARDDDVLAALDRAALALAERLDVDHVEYRGGRGPHAGWIAKPDLYVEFRRPIDPDPALNMRAIPRKQRAMVRKGIAAGLVSEIDSSTDRLHAVYGESVRNLGTPVFAPAFFRTLKRVFGPDCDIVTVLDGRRAVASVMNFYFRDTVMPYFGGGTRAARALAANDFMYWEVMRRAAERGFRAFDFGRSKRGTGAFAFKKNWGFVPEPLVYQFYLRRGTEVPQVNPLNPKYRLFIAAWKRLPLVIANRIGPLIARELA